MKTKGWLGYVTKMSACMAAAGCLALGAGTVEGDGWTATTPDSPDSALPNVLCVGDSILVGYSSPLRTLLAGKANVYTWYMAFFSTPGAAGIPAAKVNGVSALANFSAVVFNNGLHSYGWDAATVADDAIAASYAALADALAAANPQAALFYLATTPHTAAKDASGVVTGYGVYDGVMRRLNRLAKETMLAKGVPYLDAYSLLAPRLAWAAGDNFHWNSSAYTLLAQFVATSLGFYEPSAPALQSVDSGVSKADCCVYAYPTLGGRGCFNDIELHCGLSTGQGEKAIYNAFVFPALPTTDFSGATLRLPVADSIACPANFDVWGLGWTTTPGNPDFGACIWANVDATHWYNDRAPTKVCENLLLGGATASGALTCDVTDWVRTQLNRGATGHAVVRVNPDVRPTGTEDRRTRFKDADNHPSDPCRFVYTVDPTPVATPLTSFEESWRGRVGFASSEAAWATYAEASATGTAYPVVCGRVDGRDRSVVLRVPFPLMTDELSEAAFDLVVASSGADAMKIPVGVDIDVWALGVETVTANTDPAVPAFNAFLAGTADTRTLMDGVAPTRLGTVARGGGVLISGQTLAGDGAFRTNLVNWVNAQYAAGAAEGAGDHFILLRVNATAATPASVGDWGFGVGTRVTPGLASTLEVLQRLSATELPEAVNRVITLGPGVYTLTNTTALADVTNIVTSTGTELVFDIPADEIAAVPPAVTGNGTVYKMGEGSLALENAGATAYKPTGGLRVEAGELHLPRTQGTVEVQFGRVYVADGATLFLAGDDAHENTRSIFDDLSGLGTVTNGWPKKQIIQQAQGKTSAAFAGTIGGNIGNFWVYPEGRINLTGVNSSFGGSGGLPGFGTLGVVKIGYDGNENSSIGRNTIINLGPNGYTSRQAMLAYLGAGETTTKTLQFYPWDAGELCVLDAGAGGLVWNGKWEFGKQPMVWARLQGDGAATNVFGGTMAESSGATYLDKYGAGTWFLKGDNARKGVLDVKEGRLQFETLREQGINCSLGLSTLTHSAYHGKIDNAKAVPYAFVLGGGKKGEAVLECRGRAGSTAANVASRRPLALAGDGRLVTSCAEPFALSGVSSIASKGVTLTLDGDNAESTLDAVTDGASAVSLTKEGSGTWALAGTLGFSGALAVNAGTLEILGPDLPWTWYKFVIKTVNSYYSGSADSCRVNAEFALYDADGIRRNANMTISRAEANQLQPGEATVLESAARKYPSSGSTWAFDNASFELSRLFDEQAGTSSYLAGPGNGTTADKWISVVMRLPENTPPIVACDLISNNGTWNSGNRRTVAFAVEGSRDGKVWRELTNQTTNETSRFTSGWYSDGTAFLAGEVRKLSDGHGIALDISGNDGVQLANAASIAVAPGATLRARGTVTLSKLNVPEGAGGTISGFTVASQGTLVLPAAVPRGTVELPYTFSDMKDFANFRTWTIQAGGVVDTKHRVTAAGNRLLLAAGGMSLILR